MRYCARCLYPENHPLKITFDDHGVCSGCRVHEEKDEINWDEKAEELESILSHYRNRDGIPYDCVIPVNGNGDSYFVVDTIKNKLNMHPLLVTYNTHFNTKIGIRNLARLISELDCDHLMSTVSQDTVKRITRITLKKLGDIYWHVQAGSLTFPVQVATKLNIPLIILGVNGWLDQVGMFSHLDEVEMTKKVRKEHGLRGFDAEALLGDDPDLTEKDLQAYTYPSDLQLEKSRVRGLYLGNYIRWDSQKQTEYMIEKYGYETCKQERTFNPYETIYCKNNATVHDYIKYLKYGFGKATDHATRDIRLKRLTREQGIEYVKKYDAKKPSNIKNFLDWAGITEDELFECINPFRDTNIWKENKDGTFECLDSVEKHRNDKNVDKNQLAVNDPREYILTPLLEEENSKEYILLGRTYLDHKNYKAIEG